MWSLKTKISEGRKGVLIISAACDQYSFFVNFDETSSDICAKVYKRNRNFERILWKKFRKNKKYQFWRKVDSVSGKIVEKTGNSGYKIYITEDPKGDVKGVREWKRSLRICENPASY